MPEGLMQHDATVARACVQQVMSQYAMSQSLMCCTEVNAEDPLEYQCLFTADVYTCERCKFVLPSHALHTK